MFTAQLYVKEVTDVKIIFRTLTVWWKRAELLKPKYVGPLIYAYKYLSSDL